MVAKMERKALKAYIWDLDGTLLDSYEVIVSSVLDACLSFGICVTEEEAHQYIQRQSMDRRISKRTAAEEILRTLQN